MGRPRSTVGITHLRGSIMAAICWLLQHYLTLSSQDKLSSNARVQVLILIKANIIRAGRTIKDLQGDFAQTLSTVIDLRYRVNTFHDLTLNHLATRELGSQKHDINLEMEILQRTLDPTDKVPIQFLQQQDLNIWNVAAIAPRDVEFCLGMVVSMRAGTSAAIITTSIIPWW